MLIQKKLKAVGSSWSQRPKLFTEINTEFLMQANRPTVKSDSKKEDLILGSQKKVAVPVSNVKAHHNQSTSYPV